MHGHWPNLLELDPAKNHTAGDKWIKWFNQIKDSPDRYFVAGDAASMLGRIKEFIDAGCSKFVMLPMASGTADMMHQTRHFIEEVLPEYT